MSRQKRNKSSKTNIAIIILAVTAIIVLILSIAKYTSTLAANDAATTATPVLTFDTSNSLEVSISPVDGEKIYYFAVSNYTDVQVSEVTMDYYIQINSLSNLPLEFELYEYENNTIGDTNLLEGNGTTTDEIEIALDEETIHNYALKIIWQEDETSYKYADEIDYVEIVLHGEQIN